MKKHLFFTMLAATALVGFAGCSDSDDLASIDTGTTQAAEETPVSFGTYLGNAKSTRSGKTDLIDNTNFANYEFGIFAYNTGIKKFNEAVSTDIPAFFTVESDGGVYNYMNNEEISKESSDWKSKTTKYWPNQTYQKLDGSKNATLMNQYVSFFAYAPFVANPTTDDYGILAFKQGKDYKESTTNFITTGADPIIDYSAKAKSTGSPAGDVGKQVDLLWGTANASDPSFDGSYNNEGKSYNTVEGTYAKGVKVNADLTKMKTEGKVKFSFKHALARFGGNTGTSGSGSTAKTDNSITLDVNNDVVRTDGGNGDPLASQTKVYIKWIAIEFTKNNDNNAEGEAKTAIPIKGQFDLVNGKWNPVGESLTTGEGSSATTVDEKPIVYFIAPEVNSTSNSTSKSYTRSIEKSYGEYTTYKGSGFTPTDVVKVSMNEDLYADVATSGKYPVADGAFAGQWGKTVHHDAVTDPETGAVTTPASDELVTSGVVDGALTTTAQNVIKEGQSPILFIPGFSPKIRVIVSYVIITPDKNIKENYSEANQIQEDAFTFGSTPSDVAPKIDLNKKYNLKIHLGLTSIKMDATVEDWAVDNNSGSTTQEGQDEKTTGEVDLPLNQKD